MLSTEQQVYWNRVADTKTFTHPLDMALLNNWIAKDACIIDYGCGYGRLVKVLRTAGFSNVQGFDTASSLVTRGNDGANLGLIHISDAQHLPLAHASADCILLFAVLTCIPSSTEQQELIDTLFQKLKPGGILYLSDYYLQDDFTETGNYRLADGDEISCGVFTLPEGATFRHHTKEWVQQLTRNFDLREERLIKVSTMNGHPAEAFQQILQKTTGNRAI